MLTLSRDVSDVADVHCDRDSDERSLPACPSTYDTSMVSTNTGPPASVAYCM